MPDLMTADRQTCAAHLAEGLASDAHVATCGPCHRVATKWNPPTPPLVVAHEGFTSTGGYRYQATDVTRHAGPIALLEVTAAGGAQASPAPVSLEPGEAAELGLWLLRNVISHEPDAEVRALLTARIDALAREMAAVLDDER